MQTPFQRVCVRGLDVVVKRDDLLYLSGNKFRKLYWLVNKDPTFFDQSHIVSYGGLQSNAMLAIAQLAHMKSVPFTYFTKHIDVKPETVTSNFQLATALGMQHALLSASEYDELATTRQFDPVVPPHVTKWIGIPQGGATADAEEGVRVLAEEINTFALTANKAVTVLMPCGTGTTALYVAKHVDAAIDVLAVPCVGGANYLETQWRALDPTINGPRILAPRKKVAFGSLWKPLLATYYELLAATDIEFDLVYACLAWHTLFDALETRVLDLSERQLLYVHCGGVSGNPGQLARYHRRWPLSPES
ncbi:hypothetical protein ACHHYP_14591 [Achlya hypogyna]|uniref:Tryptophan synthase beta chain-like PALP domain-containing protein n=1 Tax=Achlya hypogyna TaxID=1202772 RepID=A0A1V9YCR1_ACHHY|nr:hypothetical protein ACHHYP_14591 [Achlya hypogyna]